MRFELDEDQTDLDALAHRFFNDALADDRGAILAGRSGEDPKIWTRLAGEAGFAGIAVPSDQGGAGGTWLDLAVVLEAAGRAVSSQPLFTSAGMAVAVLRAAESSADSWLADVASGEMIATWMDAARPTVGLTARSEGGSWSVSGQRSHVLHGDTAGRLLVTAATADGIGLFAIEPEHATVTPETPLDPTRSLATVALTNAPATVVTTELAGAEVARAQAFSRILLSAELVGVGQGLLDITVEHALTRHQFGRPIGGFQAVKHLLADSYAEIDSARVVARYAAWAASVADDPDDIAEDPLDLAAITAAHVSPAIQRATGAALQVLGGIGYTWEHPAHLYYKRAVSSARLLGSADQHLDWVAAKLIAAPGAERAMHA